MMGGAMGHGSGPGGMAMGFDQMDANKDGSISRDEWNAMHGGSAGGSATSRPGAGGVR